MLNDEEYCYFLEHLVRKCHGQAKAAGWWTDLETGESKQRNFGEMVALIHSELSEALEADRKGLMDEHVPQFTGVEVELADALIRIFDLAGSLNLNLGEAFVAKMNYNRERSDHKISNRVADGGKKY